jgi:hypothetical protein
MATTHRAKLIDAINGLSSLEYMIQIGECACTNYKLTLELEKKLMSCNDGVRYGRCLIMFLETHGMEKNLVDAFVKIFGKHTPFRNLAVYYLNEKATAIQQTASTAETYVDDIKFDLNEFKREFKREISEMKLNVTSVKSDFFREMTAFENDMAKFNDLKRNIDEFTAHQRSIEKFTILHRDMEAFNTLHRNIDELKKEIAELKKQPELVIDAPTIDPFKHNYDTSISVREAVVDFINAAGDEYANRIISIINERSNKSTHELVRATNIISLGRTFIQHIESRGQKSLFKSIMEIEAKDMPIIRMIRRL